MDVPFEIMKADCLLRLLWCTVIVLAMTHSGCASSMGRNVGYGGETWSLEDIFPDGPHRELAAAAARGNLGGIERALRAGVDVNFHGTGGLTPLWWATWDQNLTGFTELLKRGANPNTLPQRDEFKSREYKPEPVMYLIAQAFWSPSFLKAALAYGGNPNLESNDGGYPLAVALSQGTREHIELLLTAGASVNLHPTSNGAAPIFAAVMARRFEYVLMLLERGADPTARDRTGKDVAQLIGIFPYDPNGEQYVWRERVIRFLRKNGIEAHPPSNERKRTKPLPPDLR